ncbi:MAG TPA: CHAD domain-containing protein, partial [Solirubrobacteraceae bacterium]|nr:CHAD domain-containing protein [Solirubrobacteraceae bacterium]
PAVRVRSSVQPLAVLDGEAKSVVRLEIEHAELVGAGGHTALAPRLSLRPVLGYDRAYARTLAVLRDELGLEVAPRPLYDEAVEAAGGRPEGIATKVTPELDPATRTDAAAALVLGRLVDVAEANLPGAVEDLDPEFLHDLRVSIRRARSVLRELRGVHDPRDRAQLRDELKWAQVLTGPERDLDVQLLEWPELISHLSGDRTAELEPLRAVLERRRARERAKLRRGLHSGRFAGVLAEWRELAAAPPPPDGDEDRPNAAAPIGAVAGQRIATVLKRMLRDGARIDAASPPEALHDLRKRGKELRYLLELFGSAFSAKAVTPLVDGLKDLQKVLGRFQDRAVQVETLRELRHDLAAEADGPAALIALGPVLDALLADQEAAREEFAERFAAFAQAAADKRVAKAFGGKR